MTDFDLDIFDLLLLLGDPADPGCRMFGLLAAAPRPAMIDVREIALSGAYASATECADAAIFAALDLAAAPRPASGIKGKTPREGNARANQGCEGQIRTRFARLRSEGASAGGRAKGQRNALQGRGAGARNARKSFVFNMRGQKGNLSKDIIHT